MQTNTVMHARSMRLHRFGFSHTLQALLSGLEGNQNHIQQSVFPQGQAVSILLKGELFLWACGGICQLCFFFFSCVPQGNSQRVLLFSEMQILSSLSRWPWGFPTAAHRFKRERYGGVRWCRLRGRAHTWSRPASSCEENPLFVPTIYVLGIQSVFPSLPRRCCGNL